MSISYLQLFASFIDNKEMMKLIICRKNDRHRQWVDILPNFDKPDVFLPATTAQLFNGKITACKIVQQEVFGDIINKIKKTGSDYRNAFQKTVHDPKRRNMLASIAGFD